MTKDVLIISQKGNLMLSLIDDIQRISTVRIQLPNLQARKIAYEDRSNSILVLADSEISGVTKGQLLCYDATAYTQEDCYQFENQESGCSLTILRDSLIPNFHLIIAGTAFDDAQVPTKGRILVFTIKGKKLALCSAVPTNGGVLGLCQYGDLLCATITATINLFQIKSKSRSPGVETIEVKLLASHKSDKSVMATCVDSSEKIIVVGDIMTSISIYTQRENEIEEIGTHLFPLWTSSVHAIDDKNCLVGVDNQLLSFELQPNQKILEPKDITNVGQRINKFCKGSLVMQQIKTKYAQQAELASQLPKSSQLLSIMPQSEIPTILYATASGGIGILAIIPENTFKFLTALKDSMINHVSFFGEMNYTEMKTPTIGKLKTRVQSGHQFIDGDFVETFLNIDKKLAEDIYTAIHYPQKPSLKDTFILLRQLSLLH
jgi:DNA damage-binding protein 1